MDELRPTDEAMALDPQGDSAEGTPMYRGDIVGPGTGGSPIAGGTDDEVDADEREEALRDPAVAALIEDLRADERVLDDDAAAAAEQAGTGTDR